MSATITISVTEDKDGFLETIIRGNADRGTTKEVYFCRELLPCINKAIHALSTTIDWEVILPEILIPAPKEPTDN